MFLLKTKYIQCKDVKLAYSEHGAGRGRAVLLFLHGNSASKLTFIQYQLKHFQHYHTFAIDSRGHGKSKSTRIDYSIDQYSDDIITFCSRKGIEEAYIVGHSDGGNIALLLAHKKPAAFTRVVAISPNYLASGLKSWALKIMHAMLAGLKTLKKVGIRLDKVINILMLAMTDIGITEGDLMGIRTRVKILYAQNDMIEHDHIEEMHSLIPNCDKEMIKKANHISILFNRKAIRAIDRFLSGDNIA